MIKHGAKYGFIKTEKLFHTRATISCKIRNKADDAVKTATQEINEHLAGSYFIAFTKN